MELIPADSKLVAACGLYCGSCRSFRKGKCPGCKQNSKATWCTVRTCNQSKGYASCAECTEFTDPKQCKKFNNPISKVIGFVLRSDRAACIAQIRRIGLEEHAKNMAETSRTTIRK